MGNRSTSAGSYIVRQWSRKISFGTLWRVCVLFYYFREPIFGFLYRNTGLVDSNKNNRDTNKKG